MLSKVVRQIIRVIILLFFLPFAIIISIAEWAFEGKALMPRIYLQMLKGEKWNG